MQLTFGKYKGEDLADVPISYIKWLEEQDFINDELRRECQYQISIREGERPGAGFEKYHDH